MKSVPWTDMELATLHRMYPTAKMDELMEQIPRHTAYGIQTKARDLGIRKTNEGRTRAIVGCRTDVRYWTPEQDEKLRQAWDTLSTRAVYEAFAGERTPRGVRNRVEVLRLKRPPELVKKVRIAVAKKGGAATAKKKREQAQKREADRDAEFLRSVQTIVPAWCSAPVSLAKVLQHPLEAAWRGAL